MAILKFEKLAETGKIKGDNFQGYSVTYIAHLNSILVYGVLSNSDVYLFSLIDREWTLIKTTGKKPSFRKYYAHYFDQSLKGLFVHGGELIQKANRGSSKSQQARSSEEFYLLSTETWNWKKLFLQEVPECRQYHELIPIESESIVEVLVFGGFSKPFNRFLDDLWCISGLESLKVNSHKHEIHGCQGTQIKTKGLPPKVYGYSHTVVSGKLLILGGEHEEASNCFQAHMLCLRALEWSRLDLMSESCPSLLFPKVYFSSINREKLHIMGGYAQGQRTNSNSYCLSLSQMQVTQEVLSNTAEIVLHSCVVTDSPLCVANVEYDSEEEEMEVMFTYEKQISGDDLASSKHFETDELEPEEESPAARNGRLRDNPSNSGGEGLSIEECMIGIKQEQMLSQETIRKNIVLEDLYKEMQRYITAMYSNYATHSDQELPEVEAEKDRNIQGCEALKQKYLQNDREYRELVLEIQRLRSELSGIHEDFEKCIHTEVEEDEEDRSRLRTDHFA